MAPNIVDTGLTTWTNRHLNIHDYSIARMYDLWNAESGDLVSNYNEMTVAIRDMITAAAKSHQKLRALGGGWSWTKIATVKNGIMLNTKPLNLKFTISSGSVSEAYNGSASDLLFSQCGNSILELNEFLQRRGRSLKTSGASNGQTIVGAMSTGTHGAAIDFGAVQDYVVGIHLITSDKGSIWLERESYPVVQKGFADRINATLVQNDELFNAALVSFGSFGFMAGVMIETDELFLLECFRQRKQFNDALAHLMQTNDFTAADLPYGSERPYHFQVFINPYDKDDSIFVTTMYKRPYRSNYPRPLTENGGLGPGDDAPAFIGLVNDVVPASVPFIVNKMIGGRIKPFRNVWGTHGEIFNNFEIRGKVTSSAIGVDIANVLQVKDILIEKVRRYPFPGIFAFRFVKGTQATLGFTRFPHTCVIELDGVASKLSDEFYRAVWDELLARNIEFTFHWGKECSIDKDVLEKMYGADRIDSWLKSRDTLFNSDADMMDVFNNETLRNWGLT